MLKLGSLFDGLGGWPMAALHSGAVIPVWASEVDEFPAAVTAVHFPHMKQLGDITKIDGAKIEPVDIITAGSPCFKAGTLITTKEGQVPIEEVHVGDEVLTHENRWRKVISAGGKVATSAYTLKLTGSPITHVTGNHPYYVRHMERKGHLSKRTFSVPSWKSVDSLEKNDYIGFPVNSEERNVENLTAEECWLVGRYIADGYIRDAHRTGRGNSFNHQVIFCVGKQKKDDFLAKVTGHHVCVKEDRTTYKMVVVEQRLMNLCDRCGRGAENKTIPSFILDLPNELLEAFLDGYMSGDGCFTNGEFSATTISHSLAIGLQQVVHKLYHTPCKVSFCKRPPTCVIEGRTVNQKDTWMVRFKKQLCKQNHAVYIDGLMWMPYRRKEIEDGGIVYNLEVEEDHSYVANGAVVHNCQNLSIAGNRKGLHGEQSGLFMEAMRIVNEMREATSGKYPRFFVWENVYGSFSSNKGLDFAAVLSEIGATEVPVPDGGKWAYAGMVQCDRCEIAWRGLDAQYWGVPQRRKRIFLVADFAADHRCAGEILFKCEGVQGNPASGEGARKGTASGTEGCAGETSGKPVVLKIRQPKKKGGGSGAMWKEDQAYTLIAHQDMTIFERGFND